MAKGLSAGNVPTALAAVTMAALTVCTQSSPEGGRSSFIALGIQAQSQEHQICLRLVLLLLGKFILYPYLSLYLKKYVHVCVYVCIHIYTLCIYVCIYIHTHAQLSANVKHIYRDLLAKRSTDITEEMNHSCPRK